MEQCTNNKLKLINFPIQNSEDMKMNRILEVQNLINCDKFGHYYQDLLIDSMTEFYNSFVDEDEALTQIRAKLLELQCWIRLFNE